MKRSIRRLEKKTRPAAAALAAAALCAALVAGPAAGPAAAQQSSRLKVYISVDMEGITGVVHGDQVSPGNPGYAEARKWMADDVNAAVEGAWRPEQGR
jgi:hypothetical protein